MTSGHMTSGHMTAGPMAADARVCVDIVNQKGLHARASRKFAELAVSFPGTKVLVSKDGESALGHSLMDLMMLGAGIGSAIEICAEGPQAQEAVAALAALVSDRFGEEV
jgi:phosphocarrier protein HPr